LATGLISKGLQYRAKKGEKIYILLMNDTCIKN